MRWGAVLLSLLGLVAGGVLAGSSLVIPAYIAGYMDGLGHEARTGTTE